MKKRKICFITGSRAEYGILSQLMKEIKNDNFFEVQIIAFASHLSPEFGFTYREIEKDGFTINEKIETLLSSDTEIGITKSMGLTLISLSEAIKRLSPNLIVVLGDRYEIFAAVSAALILKIPVAHFCGGEITESAFDDSLRHAITKMSHIHFVTTEDYKKRVIQLGENPNYVFNVGEIGLDRLLKQNFLSKEEIEKELNFKFLERNILITFHPETLLSTDKIIKDFNIILEFLEKYENNSLKIFTKSNSDPAGRIINNLITDFVKKHKKTSILFDSLGRFRYLSIMQNVNYVLGNSSSGIIEAPLFKIPTINVGNRQKGRIFAESIITTDINLQNIAKSVIKINDKSFIDVLTNVRCPYLCDNSIEKVINILKDIDLNNLLIKKFYDI